MLSEKPWKPIAVLYLFIGVFGCICAGVVLSAALLPPLKEGEPLSFAHVVFGLLSFQGAALALTGFFVRQHRATWNGAFGFTNNPPRALGLGLLAGILCLLVTFGLQLLIGNLMEHFNRTPAEQEVVKSLGVVNDLNQRVVFAVLMIFLAPVAEEILFRGILYPAVKQAGYPRVALFGVSALFAAVHLNIFAFVPLFALALLLTVLYEQTNNLLATIVAHSLFNGTNLAWFYFADEFRKSLPPQS